MLGRVVSLWLGSGCWWVAGLLILVEAKKIKLGLNFQRNGGLKSKEVGFRNKLHSFVWFKEFFFTQLGDFGLAKWKANDDNVQTKILGTFGYLAPEYTESGIVSVRTDVYAFGIVLIQLISGRKVVDSNREDQQHSLRQWAEPLIERLALHKLIDPCIGDAYDTYELYHMARTAYLCVQSNPRCAHRWE
ncbi:unnamed protein product, partial [Ilex paraguariensis]